MAFVSYAQNFEDVMLWRALGNVKNGFYIDVGANDPVVDSVTKAFYERGWRGINIEPLHEHWIDLEVDRPEDINLECAVGERAGDLELWIPDVRGWATADQEVVKRQQLSGVGGAYKRVPVKTLAEICDQHVQGEIHFLKIDVEGLEEAVISGMDFKRHRPWVLLIEAVEPNSKVEVHDAWEAVILSNGYALAYSDGLNRYYISDEHAELRGDFEYPPNVFDDFVRVDQKKAFDEVGRLERELSSMRESRSWRITAPLRWLCSKF